MKLTFRISLILLIIMLFITGTSYAAPQAPSFDGALGFINGSSDNAGYVSAIQLLILFTILSLAPSILIMMTSFTRIIIVLSFLRNAIGTQQTPPNQVLIGIALFLTFFLMAPIAAEINQEAIQPYLAGEVGQEEALDTAMGPIREFMFKQTKEKDIALFLRIAKIDKVDKLEDIPTRVLIPSFIISELKTAFQIGFILYIPFLVIDMVVASTLMSMGMMMLPPVMISLPFKLLLFIMVDGWNLIIGQIISSFK
ncbi:flagellar type III secretion system pore protein FliP [Proteiniborus sp. MB09-C3]|uniref:flagellar type III secretion system pore protein FliP n=1 Tax=Proteiniborus sp. MB09-C3 TaxID=3050072 RepID=UPI00255361C6|nr:flagellar type III secretion system pore protein FliP [Proteiniborus sp. MB09-C3]WIV10870.1 flagellar type III secretion system pore protein FliP [Proteiniborus sp. MB09-C3]